MGSLTRANAARNAKGAAAKPTTLKQQQLGDIGLGERLRYGFDKSMAAGPIALVGWLSLVTLVVILFAAIILALTHWGSDEGWSFIEAVWQSLMRTMDAGTVAGDAGWAFRGLNLFVTLMGILVFSALISIISAGLDSALEALRKGRSRVLEVDHTVILNWSPSIFDIISELVVANESRKKPRIVIMANRDKVEMEDEIADKVGDLKNTQVICRSGDPTDLFDLSLVNAQTCRSIIVVSPEGSNDPDSEVIKTVLALTNDPKRRDERYRIAAELRDAKNAEVARIVGGDEVQLVLADDLISRIVVQSSRQAGVSAVYSELLDFDGCEIYTTELEDLVGVTYGEALMGYEDSALIGLRYGDGRVRMNPPMDSVIPMGARAIIIAEDDAAIRRTPLPDDAIDLAAIRKPKAVKRAAERILIIGWNRRGPMIAYELSRYVKPGSVLTVAGDIPGFSDEIMAMTLGSKNMKVQAKVIDTSHAASLEALEPLGYDSIMVLGYSDHMEPQSADTRTLITLLHLRKLSERLGEHISVVSEMIDIRNRELAEVTRADDFVVSNKLVSLMLAQASENEYLSSIFDDLLDEEGSEIYMRPIGDYVDLALPQNFYTIAEAARQRGETAIGYRRKREGEGAKDDDGRNMGGVVVNPPKSEALEYLPEDRVIVLAED
ncbi:CASTOR/POLLUX-related putative ion channel [Brevundimonas sp.]|uniref:CASTOR/POLLUX-related putative ion channel n=1 Tax=Brevundimonas sp. TaxID=1871086 RepID=UPI003BA94596